MTKIAVLGIPIMWLHEDRSQVFIPMATDQPRKDLEKLLHETAFGITVVNLGEVSAPTENFSGDYYNSMGAEVQSRIADSGADTVLAIGGDHVSALPLYYLPGNVVRADAHGDVYVFKNARPSFQDANGGTYVYHAVQQGLKSAGEIKNVGINPSLHSDGFYNNGVIGESMDMHQILSSQPPSTAFLDIDVDVLSRHYRLPHGESTSNLLVRDLAKLIVKLKPYVVGLFECVGKDGFIREDIIMKNQRVFRPIAEAVGQLDLSKSLGNFQDPSAGYLPIVTYTTPGPA